MFTRSTRSTRNASTPEGRPTIPRNAYPRGWVRTSRKRGGRPASSEEWNHIANTTASAAVCTYNGAAYIREQVLSLLAQTHPLLEIVICDDGSTDGTRDILAELEKQNPDKIRYVPNPERLGRNKNFEKAIGLCRGEVIFLADQDDVFVPGKVAHMVGAFESDPSCTVVFSDAVVVDAHLRVLSPSLVETVWPPFSPKRLARVEGEDVFREIVRNSPALGSAMAFRRELLRHVVPIPEFAAHDYWILFLGAMAGSVRHVRRPLHLYRQHGGNLAGVEVSKIAKFRRRMASFRATYRSECVETTRTWEEIHVRARSMRATGDAATVTRVDAAIPWIEGKLRYQRRRLALRSAGTRLSRRLGALAATLMRGDYARYGRGLYSFTRDATGIACATMDRKKKG